MNAALPEASKTHTSENFPVASVIIAPAYRPAIMAFYRFARCADDIADDAKLDVARKYALLDAMEATLRGQDATMGEALPLQKIVADHPNWLRHPLDLLRAFRLDVEKRRYANWDELMHYCRYSASPVGRFVLSVHGEPESLWPANDALCSALQVINHLQDCGKDFRAIDRVYLSDDLMQAAGIDASALQAPMACTGLRRVLDQMLTQTASLLQQSADFSAAIADYRLAMEVAVIQKLALRLVAVLQQHDPLKEKVHLSKGAMLSISLSAFGAATASRWFGRSGRARP